MLTVVTENTKTCCNAHKSSAYLNPVMAEGVLYGHPFSKMMRKKMQLSKYTRTTLSDAEHGEQPCFTM